MSVVSQEQFQKLKPSKPHTNPSSPPAAPVQVNPDTPPLCSSCPCVNCLPPPAAPGKPCLPHPYAASVLENPASPPCSSCLCNPCSSYTGIPLHHHTDQGLCLPPPSCSSCPGNPSRLTVLVGALQYLSSYPPTLQYIPCLR